MNRTVLPLLIPLTALLMGGIIVFSISRLLLAFTKEVAPPIALGLAIVILLGAAFAASRVDPG